MYDQFLKIRPMECSFWDEEKLEGFTYDQLFYECYYSLRNNKWAQVVFAEHQRGRPEVTISALRSFRNMVCHEIGSKIFKDWTSREIEAIAFEILMTWMEDDA